MQIGRILAETDCNTLGETVCVNWDAWRLGAECVLHWRRGRYKPPGAFWLYRLLPGYVRKSRPRCFPNQLKTLSKAWTIMISNKSDVLRPAKEQRWGCNYTHPPLKYQYSRWKISATAYAIDLLQWWSDNGAPSCQRPWCKVGRLKDLVKLACEQDSSLYCGYRCIVSLPAWLVSIKYSFIYEYMNVTSI